MILSSTLPPSLSVGAVAPALLALVAYAVAGATSMGVWSHRALSLAWWAHGAALLAHLVGFGLPGEGARFGFAPALSAAAWMVLAVHWIESRLLPMPAVRRLFSVVCGGSVLLALLFPGEGAIHPGSPWAPLHWLLGLASYGLFGAAVLHAAWLDRAERAMRHRGVTPASGNGGGVPLLTLEKLTFRFVAAGFWVLSVAIGLGAWFAPVLRWDHKNVFSVLGWLVFAGLLAGRHLFGWRGRRATGWLYVGTGLLLLAYVGSRFVFEVLLHRSASMGA
ncbi:MAG: inner membrane protein YpjD [Leptothrix sp. (in: b-proteobacteria)]